MDTGLAPDDNPKLWNQWRCDCVTALLRDIQRTAKSLRPQLVLSAAVAVERTQALRKFQVCQRPINALSQRTTGKSVCLMICRSYYYHLLCFNLQCQEF